MPRRSTTPSDEEGSWSQPASTPDDREAQLISLADRLAERQLRDGSASSQVITHYLKLGSSRERLEQEKIGLEKQLLEAKADQIKSQQRTEEMFAAAIKAMRQYQGVDDGVDPEPYQEGEYFQ